MRATLALALPAARATRPVVVVSDAGEAPLGLPALPAARRVSRLAEAPSAARGRLVLVRPGREELVRCARRMAARAPVPVVLALGAPRDEAADVLLAESLRVVVLAEPAGPLAQLALAQLAAIGVVAQARAPLADLRASLAMLGWGLPGEARVAEPRAGLPRAIDA